MLYYIILYIIHSSSKFRVCDSKDPSASWSVCLLWSVRRNTAAHGMASFKAWCPPARSASAHSLPPWTASTCRPARGFHVWSVLDTMRKNMKEVSLSTIMSRIWVTCYYIKYTTSLFNWFVFIFVPFYVILMQTFSWRSTCDSILAGGFCLVSCPEGYESEETPLGAESATWKALKLRIYFCGPDWQLRGILPQCRRTPH